VGTDGRTLLTIGNDHVVRIWDVSADRLLGRLVGTRQRFVLGVAFGPDGSLHVAGETATRFAPDTFAPIGELRLDRSPVGGIAVSPDGARVVTGGFDREAVVWDLGTNQPVLRLRHDTMPWVTAVAYSPDGTRIVTGAGDYANRSGEARLWDAATGAVIAELDGHTREVMHVAFSPDGRTVATCSRDFKTRFWDAATGQPLGEPVTHTSWVHAAAISPDGKTLLTGSDKEQLVIWRLADRERLAEIVRHAGVVRAVGFTPDGRLYLTGSVDAMARVWDARTRRPVGPPLRHLSEVGTLAVRSDGRVLATGSTAGWARLWPLPAAGTRITHEWVETHTGQMIGPDDEIDALPPEVWHSRVTAAAVPK
jgi:WD40 repeat protein